MKTTLPDKSPGLTTRFGPMLRLAAAIGFFSATAFSQEVAPAPAAGATEEADEDVLRHQELAVRVEVALRVRIHDAVQHQDGRVRASLLSGW